jgi:hypothetical protein
MSDLGTTATLDEVLALLPPDHRAVVEEALPQPGWRRRRQRDDAVREVVLRLYAGTPAISKVLACDLRRYAAAGWRADRDAPMPNTDVRRELFSRLLRLNNGRVLSARSIRRILSTG